jgi:DNA-binding NarL/FixJ family response regulator
MIDIAIYDEHNLVLQGISNMLSGVTDFRVIFTSAHRAQLVEKIKTSPVHILIFNMHEISVRNLNLIVQLKITDPKVRILVISILDSEEIILKTIKAGAKGFLGKDSGINELMEAIYTLRNGHDYFSKSITHLLLNRYISDLDAQLPKGSMGIGQLSARQIEILRLWGESYSNQEIAEKLFISIRTVETHKNHIMQKLNLKSTVDMVKFAIKSNIIDI